MNVHLEVLVTPRMAVCTASRHITRIMESAERPAKIRKLSHDGAAGIAVTLPAHGDISKLVSAAVSPDQAEHAQNEALESTANEAAVKNEQDPDNEVGAIPPDSVRGPLQTPNPLSKNQLKKQRRKEEWEAGKDRRKARQKEKDAEKKIRKREQKQKEKQERIAQGLDPQPESRPKWRRPVRLPVTFLIDCGFDDKMSEKERISLGSQVTRAYSDNFKAPFQAHIAINSWNGLLKKRFDTVLSKQYTKWRGVYFTDQDFVSAAETAKARMTGEKGGSLAGVFEKYKAGYRQEPNIMATNGSDSKNGGVDETPKASGIDTEGTETNTVGEQTSQHPRDTPTDQASHQSSIPLLYQQSEIIYLTSDSPHTLTELKPFSTYIIGGLVDKNRHKGICYKTACEKNIKTAKLPIGQYMEMQSRFVLATNHVVEIMVYWLECGDWGEAFMKAIPKRKGGRLRNGKGEGEEDDGDGKNDGRVEKVDEKNDERDWEDDDAGSDGEDDGEDEQDLLDKAIEEKFFDEEFIPDEVYNDHTPDPRLPDESGW